MKKKKIIAYTNFKTKNPLWETAITVMMLDYWEAPQWLWGVVGCLWFLLWVLWIVGFWTEEEVDVFKEKEK